jgi:hypothetical protein
MCPTAQVETFDATLQKSTESITLTVDPNLHEAWLLEISPNPYFYPSIGRFGLGPTADIAAELLERFSGCDLHLRIGPAYPTRDRKQLKTYRLAA